MHLLYYGNEQEKLLQNKSVEAVLRDLSVKQGRVYDSPESVKSIPSFIKTYSIQTEELRQPDISTYKTFNEFFYRCAEFHVASPSLPPYSTPPLPLAPHEAALTRAPLRQLREDARPVQHADVPGGFCSAADSRLTVYSSVDLAKQFWVKGSHFSIPALLGVAPDSAKAKQFENGRCVRRGAVLQRRALKER
jgi:phosphatidylserine decarboxylase